MRSTAIVPVGTPARPSFAARSSTTAIPNCVPYDIFGTGPSAAVGQLTSTSSGSSRAGRRSRSPTSTSPAHSAKWACRRPGRTKASAINVGAEYRKESLDLNPDQEFQTGDLAGQGAPTLPVSGNFRVLEAFGEVQIPIIRHRSSRSFRSSRLPQVMVQAEQRPCVRYGHVQDRRRIRPDPRHPFPRFVQPGVRVRRILRNCLRRSSSALTAATTRARASRSRLPIMVVLRGPGRRLRYSGNPAGQYNGLLGRQPEPEPGKGDDQDGRRRASAAHDPEARVERRLLEHQPEERDPGLRR